MTWGREGDGTRGAVGWNRPLLCFDDQGRGTTTTHRFGTQLYPAGTAQTNNVCQWWSYLDPCPLPGLSHA